MVNSNHSRGLAKRKLLQCIFWCSGGLLFAYLSLATQLFVGSLSLRYWFIINIVYLACFTWFVRKLGRDERRRKILPQLTAAAVVTIGTLLFADTLYNLWVNQFATPLPFRFEQTAQTGALEINLGLPRFNAGYDGRNKPHVSMGGEIFGELVPPALVDDPTFRELVVRTRYVEYRLDEFGYRNEAQSWPQAEIVAMGDSFVFGASLAESKTWVRLLEQKLGTHNEGIRIYNLGESGTSPLGQAKRLQDLLESQPAKPKTILWMIFGGNDLEADQTDEFAGDTSRVLDHTVFSAVVGGLEVVRSDSIIGRVRAGRLAPLRYPPSHYYQDRLLPAPLYQSSKLGAKLFYPPYIVEAGRTPEDVLADPQLTDITRAFEIVREISSDLRANVLVLFAPSAEHLLGAQFDDFPTTANSTFADWVQETASEHGFAFKDLSPALAKASANTMPYFTDDTHWNEFGHSVVADEVDSQLQTADRE